MRVMVKRLYDLATHPTRPDVAAARLLMEYAIGRPPAAVDPDRLDVDEMDPALRAPHIDDVHLLDRAAPEVVAWLLRKFQASSPEEYVRLVEERMRETQARVRELQDISDFGFALGDDEDEEDAVEAS